MGAADASTARPVTAYEEPESVACVFRRSPSAHLKHTNLLAHDLQGRVTSSPTGDGFGFMAAHHPRSPRQLVPMLNPLWLMPISAVIRSCKSGSSTPPMARIGRSCRRRKMIRSPPRRTRAVRPNCRPAITMSRCSRTAFRACRSIAAHRPRSTELKPRQQSEAAKLWCSRRMRRAAWGSYRLIGSFWFSKFGRTALGDYKTQG